MINWIFENKEIISFLKKSSSKRQKFILERQINLGRKFDTLHERLSNARAKAKQIATLRRKSGSTEKIITLKNYLRQDIAGVYSLLNDYTRSILWLEVHRAMSLEGFVSPEELTILREHVDYGLLDLKNFEGIDEILDRDVDPFSDIAELFLK